jgi:O-antigen/teichoic acid export membrane protein
VIALFSLGNAIVRAAGQVIPSMLASLAPSLLFLGFLLLALVVAERRISVSSAQLMYLGSFAGGLIVIALMWHQKEGAKALPRREYRTPEWFGTATLMTLGSSLMYLQGRTGVLVSGWFLVEQEVGTYAAVERLADAALLGVVAMNMLTAPQFSSLHARGQHCELRRHVRMAACVSTMFMLAVLLPMVVAGRPLLRLFGDDFVAGYPVLLVLLASVGFNAMSGSVDFLLNMTGNQRVVLKILASALTVNLALSLILIPRFGIVGTAVASAASSLFWNGAMLVAARRRLGIWSNVGRFGSSRFI